MGWPGTNVETTVSGQTMDILVVASKGRLHGGLRMSGMIFVITPVGLGLKSVISGFLERLVFVKGAPVSSAVLNSAVGVGITIPVPGWCSQSCSVVACISAFPPSLETVSAHCQTLYDTIGLNSLPDDTVGSLDNARTRHSIQRFANS